MKKTGNLLTRKFGPLPAWAWLGIFAVGVWYYRNKLGGGTASGTGTGSVGPAAATPQDPVVLQPGESVYNPGTGTLSTAPGGDASGGGGNSTTSGDGGGDNTGNSNDVASSIDGLTQAIDQWIASQQPGDPGGTSTTSSPPPASTRGKKKPKVTKPKTKRTPKGKANHHKPPGKTTKPPHNGKTRHRSTSNVRNKTAGRTTGQHKAAGNAGRTRGGAKPNATQHRTVSRHSTPKTGVVGKQVVRQRPVASHTPHAAHHPATHTQPSAHRPPQTRTASRTRRHR